MEISAYRIMWIFTFFDIPVVKEKDRKEYIKFRKYLLKEGFTMHQYSVYIRHCPTREYMNATLKRVEKNLPKCGHVSLMGVTDKQFSEIKHFFMRMPEKPPENPGQISIF